MKNAETSKLGTEPVLALILGIFRADRFYEGTLEEFIKNNCFNKWLKRLKEIDGY